MKYTKRRFGAELILELEKDIELKRDFDTTRISKWANKIHYDHIGETDDELNTTIQNIGSMAFGPEFEFTRKELLKIAIDFILSETDQNTNIQEKNEVFNGIYFENGAQNLPIKTDDKE